jgi:hypothetical protein
MRDEPLAHQHPFSLVSIPSSYTDRKIAYGQSKQAQGSLGAPGCLQSCLPGASTTASFALFASKHALRY